MFKFSGLKLSPFLLILPLLVAALLGAGLLWRRRETGDLASQTERARAEAAYATALKLLRRRVSHAAHMAPAEYKTRVAQSALSTAAKQEFSALTHLYLAARYGPTQSPGATNAPVDDCLHRLKSASRRGRRATSEKGQ